MEVQKISDGKGGLSVRTKPMKSPEKKKEEIKKEETKKEEKKEVSKGKAPIDPMTLVKLAIKQRSLKFEQPAEKKSI